MNTDKLSTRAARTSAAALIATAGLVGTTAWGGIASAAPSRPVQAATATKAMPGLLNCGLGKVEVKPKTLILSCADANSQGTHLVWSKWATAGAKATGTFTWNLCTPNCAASKTWGKSTATYTLSRLVHTTKYGWLFEKLTVHITGKKTGGFPRTMTYPQAPVK